MSIEETYDLYVDKVFKFFYIKSFDRQLAEDLTSQTFMVLVERSDDPEYVIQNDKKFIYGVMRTVWLMYLRQKYQRNEQTIDDIEDFEAYVDEGLDEFEGMTVKQRAAQYIDRLPDKQRQVLTMRLLEGLSIKDICQETGKDSNYIKTTYKRGVKSLQALIVAQQLEPVPATVQADEEIV
ncbi:MAG TPA: sigma-70 family RNA polymerase sigma factor [Candidatus Saccharimonadales bacterium]|jgi:RNA polymerase sigma-70 factor (ECF subfamily)